MNPRRRLVTFASAVAVLAAATWMITGGMSIAQGQEEPIVIKRAHAGSYRPSFTRPIFILALGTDSGARRYGRGGRYETGRSDSIHIIAINPRLKKATVVGIPRDAYIPIACGSSPNKINAASFFGGLSNRGPECMVRTVEGLSGGRIKFDYYMVGGFEQLEDAVNALGGIPVTVERPLGGRFNDTASRSHGMRSGLNTLTGRQALSYARNRHEYGRGDFDRSRHQGQVMIGALTRARQLVAAEPGKALTFLRIMLDNMKSDIPALEGFRLGLIALQIAPGDVTNTLLDGSTGNRGGASVVVLSNPRRILDDVADNAIID